MSPLITSSHQRVHGRELHQKYGHYYFDFSFREGKVEIEGYNIVASLWK